jgi:RNA polymerase sigma-70 factor (ECF subfamily)
MLAARLAARTHSGNAPSDAALVLAARGGDAPAAELLFRRYARMATGLALRLLGRDSDVDDLVQESFVQAYASLGRLQEPQAFASWLASILVRTAHKMIRRRRMLARFGIQRNALDVDMDALIASDVPPDDAMDLRRIYSLVPTLPAEVRIPLVLRRVDGRALNEIAQMCGCSLATVKRRIEAGEQLLEKRFRGRGES